MLPICRIKTKVKCVQIHGYTRSRRQCLLHIFISSFKNILRVYLTIWEWSWQVLKMSSYYEIVKYGWKCWNYEIKQHTYFLAKLILMAFVGLILNPWSASLADVDCSAPSNSTKAMSARPGTKRTSLNPGNCGKKYHNSISNNRHTKTRFKYDLRKVDADANLVEQHPEHHLVSLLR